MSGESALSATLEGLEENIGENCWSKHCYSRHVARKLVDVEQKVAVYIVACDYMSERAGIEHTRTVHVYRPRKVGGKLVPATDCWWFLVRDRHDERRDNPGNYFDTIESLAVSGDEVRIVIASGTRRLELTTLLRLESTEAEHTWEEMVRVVVSGAVRALFDRNPFPPRSPFPVEHYTEKLERLADELATHKSFNLNAIQLYCGLGLIEKAAALNSTRKRGYPDFPPPIDLDGWRSYGCSTEKVAVVEMLITLKRQGLL